MQEKSAGGIVAKIRDDIEQGHLITGTSLPSIRDNAALIGVNRNTVAAAYQKLTMAGLIEKKGRKMCVSRRPFNFNTTDTIILPEGVKDLSIVNPDHKFIPAISHLSAHILSEPQALYGTQPDNPNLVNKFKELAASQGINDCESMIVAGTTEGMERLLLDYLNPGDQIIVEDPCYMKLLYLLRSMGITPTPVPMMAEGMDIKTLTDKINHKTKAIVLTPRAQNPTGASYSQKRAQEIHDELKKYPDLLVIEDEHLGPLSSLPYHSTIDKTRKNWAIFCSIAKYLGPDYRIAAMLASPTTINRMKSRRAAGSHWVSHMIQKLVYAVWTDSQTIETIITAKKAYQNRRIHMMDALRKQGIHAESDDGMFIWLPTEHAELISAHLYRTGWNVRTGRDFCIKAKNGLRITTALIATNEAEQLAIEIRRAMITNQSMANPS